MYMSCMILCEIKVILWLLPSDGKFGSKKLNLKKEEDKNSQDELWGRYANICTIAFSEDFFLQIFSLKTIFFYFTLGFFLYM